jgi:hypothetical protein
MINSENSREELYFKDHFLSKRLSRVPIDVLKKFILNWTDIKKLTNQKKLVSEILFQLNISKNDRNFISSFKNFLRDYVLSARESEYLLQTDDRFKVLSWLKTLNQQSFSGQK